MKKTLTLWENSEKEKKIPYPLWCKTYLFYPSNEIQYLDNNIRIGIPNLDKSHWCWQKTFREMAWAIHSLITNLIKVNWLVLCFRQQVVYFEELREDSEPPEFEDGTGFPNLYWILLLVFYKLYYFILYICIIVSINILCHSFVL